MHIYPAFVIGTLSWGGIMLYDPTIQALLCAPLVISGIALALMLLPLVRKAG